MQRQSVNATKQSKQKYLKPQIFSISTTMKPMNNAHCRSLVDLNQIETSEEKENNYDHFTSVTSNQDTKNINFNVNWGTGLNNPAQPTNAKAKAGGQNRQVLVDKGNISNIAKILLNASKGKNGDNRLQISANKNSSTPMQNQGRKNDILMDILNPKAKMQARTSSQTNLRQANSSLTKNNSNKPTIPLKAEKSQKSLKKSQPTQQSPHSALYHQLPHQSYKAPASPIVNECNLLLKLKQYIEQLKENEQTHLTKIKQLSDMNKGLQQEMTLLKDKVEVYQIRQKEMMSKIKFQQNQIHKLNAAKKDSHKTHADKAQCQEHLLIIQSLRNVINQQMTKIIEMETYKVQLNQQKNKKKYKKSEEYWQTNQSEPNSAEERHHQVYSFKKRSNLNQSSIYIQDEQRQHPPTTTSQSNYRTQQQRPPKKNKNQESIPEPYNELIKCLKSDSRRKPSPNPVATNQQYSHRSSIDMQFESERNIEDREQFGDDCYREGCEANQEEFQYFDEIRDKDQCSEDQILQEVGQYLQNIRRNVRES